MPANTSVRVESQLLVDSEQRSRVDYPADGYLTSNPAELQNQDWIDIPANTSRIVWERLAGDVATDDWDLMWIEARNATLRVELATEDVAQAPVTTYELPLGAGLPLMLNSRALPTTVASYIYRITVQEQNGIDAGVRFAIAR